LESKNVSYSINYFCQKIKYSWKIFLGINKLQHLFFFFFQYSFHSLSPFFVSSSYEAALIFLRKWNNDISNGWNDTFSPFLSQETYATENLISFCWIVKFFDGVRNLDFIVLLKRKNFKFVNIYFLQYFHAKHRPPPPPKKNH
jgi:hypothetical protein